MSTLKATLLAVLVVPAGVCFALSFLHWARTFGHVRPGAAPGTPFGWRREDPSQYTAEGQRQLALSLRYRRLGLALSIGAVAVNVFLA